MTARMYMRGCVSYILWCVCVWEGGWRWGVKGRSTMSRLFCSHGDSENPLSLFRISGRHGNKSVTSFYIPPSLCISSKKTFILKSN